jgi:ABC-type Fe3+ transport system permease subunit
MQRRQTPGTAGFRPRATLGLVYFVGFLMLFCVLFVAPALWRGFERVSADPTQWDDAQEAVRTALGSRFWIAVALATIATVVGGRLRLLPGTR